MYKVQEIIKSVPDYVGEGPHWDVKSQALLFVSMPDNFINKYVLSTGEHTKTALHGPPSFIIPVEGSPDQFVTAVNRNFLIIQWDGKEGSEVKVVKDFGEVDPDTNNRINDGKADPRGRLFSGTMGATISFKDVLFETDKGSIYRIDNAKGGAIDRLDQKISMSNGLAWDLKEKALYYIDTLERKVRRYDYDVETGDISNMSYIFDLSKNDVEGFPDGCTIDTDGNLWVAVFNGHCVIKIDPRTGKLLQKLSLPVKQVTSVTFGGPNYDILFVTTGAIKDDKEQPPPSGSTFMVTGLGVKGQPSVNFKL